MSATAVLPTLHDVQVELASRRLIHFVRYMWDVIEPRAPFVDGWHIGAICEHLEAITSGQIHDLLINVPPGCMKSLLVSVFWPAWEWTRHPEYRYLFGSYDEALSIRDNRRCRDVIDSPRYQASWPLELRSDQNTKTRYDNLKSGWRIGTSVDGKGTGEHPHRKVIDDPHNVKQSLSGPLRKKAISWFSLTMGSRGLGLDAATVVIMQRLHEEDLSGHILAEYRGVFDHLCLPMRYEPPARVVLDGVEVMKPRMEPTRIGFQDPRTEPGELLFPGLLDEAKTAKLERALKSEHGEFGVAGQLQQRPTPMAGGMFKREWFKIIPKAVAAPLLATARRCRGWDAAGTEGDGDYTAGVLMAAISDGRYLVEDVVRGQWGPGAGDNVLKSTAMADPWGTAQREEQEPGSAGKKVIASHLILLAGLDYAGETSSGDKQTRARPFAAQCEGGNVLLVEGDWNKAYIDELCAFPRGTYDDQVDGSSTAFNHLALGYGSAGTVPVTGA